MCFEGPGHIYFVEFHMFAFHWRLFLSYWDFFSSKCNVTNSYLFAINNSYFLFQQIIFSVLFCLYLMVVSLIFKFLLQYELWLPWLFFCSISRGIFWVSQTKQGDHLLRAALQVLSEPPYCMSFVLTRLVSCHLGSDLGGWLERLAEWLRFPFLKLEGGVLTKKLGEGLQHPQTELGWGRPQPARHSLPGTRLAPGLFFVPVALPFRARSPPDPFQLVWQGGAWPCVAHPAPREVTVLGNHTSEYFSLPQAKSMRLFPVLGNCEIVNIHVQAFAWALVFISHV